MLCNGNAGMPVSSERASRVALIVTACACGGLMQLSLVDGDSAVSSQDDTSDGSSGTVTWAEVLASDQVSMTSTSWHLSRGCRAVRAGSCCGAWQLFVML